MKLSSESFADGQPIPPEFAFCRIDPKSHVTLSTNRNPQLSWSAAPVGTRSFAIVCHDPDVPSVPDDVNQDGREIPSTLARIEFFHWVLVDLPASAESIAAGEFSDNVTPKGKMGPAAHRGARQGVNDYTVWFAGDHDMEGDYYGYDGPCPPWNDSIVHRYVFTVYALDVERLPLTGRFSGADARKVIAHHRLGEASITGIYTLNPRLAAASA
ncbi:MAG: YbhB/YbcL family Raf kinase inhibitor-like protein [Burkholderiales bacterium]|nr:MAG: YbhB/YbcL family Raf kinase inhibitor-like protein [Burkholderiales bacterium]